MNPLIFVDYCLRTTLEINNKIRVMTDHCLYVGELFYIKKNLHKKERAPVVDVIWRYPIGPKEIKMSIKYVCLK